MQIKTIARCRVVEKSRIREMENQVWRMWRNVHSLHFPVGTENGTATLGPSWTSPQKVTHRIYYKHQLAIPLLAVCREDRKHLPPIAYCTQRHNLQQPKSRTKSRALSGVMGETRHPNNEIVSNHGKKRTGVLVCATRGGAQKHGVLENKSGTKGCRRCDPKFIGKTQRSKSTEK